MDQSKFDRLIVLLDEAEELASQFTGGYSNHFFGAKEFHEALKVSIQNLKGGDINEIETLYLYFLPTSDWDDFTGFEGMSLGNEIFGLILNIRET